MIRTILVPLDGSTFAESALPLALTISRRGGAEVELATVHEPVPTFAYHEWEQAAREWSESYLSDVKERVSASVGSSIETSVHSGRVADTLCKRAEELGADLAVMATHGRGAFTRTWLGGVADSFLRHAPCPVLLVRPDEEGQADVTGDWAPGTILVPLDGSELSTTILDRVTELAQLFGSRILLLRVVAYPVEIASPYLPHTVRMNQEIVEEAKTVARQYLKRVAAPLAARGLEVDQDVVVDTQAGHGILKAAQERDVGLIAMSTHGRGGVVRAVLGSTADKVIRGAHRPVLAYRPEE
jgi:nucleotide-binding universal stress UspA family protein